MKKSKQELREALLARVRLLETTLARGTISQYQLTVKRFLAYLREHHPEIGQPGQLRRDPHILGWLHQLWTWRSRGAGQGLCKQTRAQHVIQLRKLMELLADHRHPPPPGLIWSEDIPRLDHTLPRPLQPADDERLQQQLRDRHDVFSNALLLQRLTGMRLGECVDLAPDCLRHMGENQWALHVPLGKLYSERWVPVDEQVCHLVERLEFLRTLPPGADARYLLPRPKGRTVLCGQLRLALREAAQAAGIVGHVVPHRLRHTYATTMLRAGVSLPALMKLLGHRTANMTLRYVEITQRDLQREFQQARLQRAHFMPPLPAGGATDVVPSTDPLSVFDLLSGSLRLLELHRQRSEIAAHAKLLLLISRRLSRILMIFKKLNPSIEPKSR